jgi:hypothetical protein
MSRNGVSIVKGVNWSIGFDGLFFNVGGCCGGETSDAELGEVALWKTAIGKDNVKDVVAYLSNKWLAGNIARISKSLCVSGLKYTKVGDFKLGYIDTRADYNMNKPEYKSGGWIFTANKNNWMKMTEGQRNETWAMVVLSPNKSNGENVSEITIEVAKKNNIGERISQEIMFFNYLLKHKTKDSSIILQKCGYINAWNEDIASIVGMYIGNNWSTQYQATHGQFVKNIEGKSTGVPHINEEYELYYAVSTDFCY